MANEKKTETMKMNNDGNESKLPVPHASTYSEAHGVELLERIAVSLERLADAFAPRRSNTVPGRPLARTCEKGHGMQATDDYCQVCHVEMKGAKLPDEAA